MDSVVCLMSDVRSFANQPNHHPFLSSPCFLLARTGLPLPPPSHHQYHNPPIPLIPRTQVSHQINLPTTAPETKNSTHPAILQPASPVTPIIDISHHLRLCHSSNTSPSLPSVLLNPPPRARSSPTPNSRCYGCTSVTWWAFDSRAKSCRVTFYSSSIARNVNLPPALEERRAYRKLCSLNRA